MSPKSFFNKHDQEEDWRIEHKSCWIHTHIISMIFRAGDLVFDLTKNGKTAKTCLVGLKMAHMQWTLCCGLCFVLGLVLLNWTSEAGSWGQEKWHKNGDGFVSDFLGKKMVFWKHPFLKLTVRTRKWMVGRRSFPFGMTYFQGRFDVSFREGILNDMFGFFMLSSCRFFELSWPTKGWFFGNPFHAPFGGWKFCIWNKMKDFQFIDVY